jgi:hypothetical protein
VYPERGGGSLLSLRMVEPNEMRYQQIMRQWERRVRSEYGWGPTNALGEVSDGRWRTGLAQAQSRLENFVGGS